MRVEFARYAILIESRKVRFTIGWLGGEKFRLFGFGLLEITGGVSVKIFELQIAKFFMFPEIGNFH